MQIAAGGAIRRLLRAVVRLMALVLLLGSCEFFGYDIYPPQYQGLVASVDLKAQLATHGLSLERVESVNELRRPGNSSILALSCKYKDGTSSYVFLDAVSLSWLGSYAPSYRLPVGTDMDGCIVIGSAILDPVALTPLSRPNAPSADSFILDRPATNASLVVAAMGNSTATFWLFSSGWITPLSYFAQIDAFFNNYDIVSAIVLPTGAARIALRPSGSYSSSVVVLDYPSVDYLVTRLQAWVGGVDTLFNIATSSTSIPEIDSASPALVSGGLIGLRHWDGATMVRFDPVTGKELDKKSLDDEFVQGLGFAPDGRHYYYFDSHTGKLLKFATWWSP